MLVALQALQQQPLPKMHQFSERLALFVLISILSGTEHSLRSTLKATGFNYVDVCAVTGRHRAKTAQIAN
jgi:hypothetical protein